jgi:hypothetical protein
MEFGLFRGLRIFAETGLALSKLVSKLDAGSRTLGKIHESVFGPGLCKKITRASSFQGEHRYLPANQRGGRASTTLNEKGILTGNSYDYLIFSSLKIMEDRRRALACNLAAKSLS